MTVAHYRKSNNFGPGGKKCSCCTTHNTLGKNLRMLNKSNRRKDKVKLKSGRYD